MQRLEERIEALSAALEEADQLYGSAAFNSDGKQQEGQAFGAYVSFSWKQATE